MAITRAQQAKQMLQDGGMLVKPGFGGTRQGYRGDAAAASGAPGMADTGPAGDVGDGPASRDFGGPDRDEQMGMKGKTRPGRNPMAQFGGIQPPPAYDEDGTSTRNFNFMKDTRRRVNPFGFLTNLPGLAGLTFRALTPNPFGFSPTAPQSPLGEGAGQELPYWAKLGFSSEEEYLASLRAQASDTTEQETEEEPFQLSRRFRAEGGIMNADIVGGEFDFESARQMYGLGKLVKKVTKTVKKIAKSDVGKAAIAAASIYYLGGGGNPFTAAGRGSFSFGKLPGAGFFKGKPFTKTVASFGLDRQAFNAARTAAGTSSGGLGIGTLIGGTAIAAGLLTPEEETEAEELSRGEGIDIEAARNAILAAKREQYMMDVRARGFKADGGRIEYQEGSKEPVAKKTMPLLDLDGKEMD